MTGTIQGSTTPNIEKETNKFSRIHFVILAFAFFGHAIAALFYAVIIDNPVVARAAYFGLKLFVNTIPLIWFFCLDRQKIRLPSFQSAACFVGLLSGLLIAGSLVFLHGFVLAEYIKIDGLYEKAAVYGLRDHFFWFATFLCVVNSGMEEYYWRWFIFGKFRQLMPVSLAIFLSSISFTLHHIVVLFVYIPDLSMVILFNLGVFAGGLIWAGLYQKFSNFWAIWLSHLIVDVGIMVIVYKILFPLA